MYVVNLIEADKLPHELKEEHEYADDYELILVIQHNGAVIASHSARSEPEDVSFYRDLRWVAPALRDAYNRGLNDGKS